MGLDWWRFIDAQRRIRVKVALFDSAVLDRYRAAQRSRESEDRSALYLCVDHLRIDPAIHNPPRRRYVPPSHFLSRRRPPPPLAKDSFQRRTEVTCPCPFREASADPSRPSARQDSRPRKLGDCELEDSCGIRRDPAWPRRPAHP